MKAWRIYEPFNVKLDEMASQPVGETCVKLKVLGTAISHTDNVIFEGKKIVKYPLTLGRQCIAMVSETGEKVTNLARGNKVVVAPYAACHNCSACKDGRTSDCDKLLDFGISEEGFFKDFAVVSSEDVYKLPDRIADKDAVFLEHIATAINTVNKLNLEKGEHIAIIGASVTGMILAQVAMYYQAVPLLVDMRQDRLDIAASLGVYYTINSVNTDPYKKIFSLTGGRTAETMAYMSESVMPLTRAFDLCMKHGRVALIGGSINNELNANYSLVMNKQLSVLGVSGVGKNMPSAINMLANKTVNVSSLVSKEIGFNDIGAMLLEMSQMPSKYMKVVVDMAKS